MCNQRLYLLKVLRGLGLNRKGLDCVFSAVVLSRLIYAWGNFVSKDQEGRINKTLKRHTNGGCRLICLHSPCCKQFTLKNSSTRLVSTRSTVYIICFLQCVRTHVITTSEKESMTTRLSEPKRHSTGNLIWLIAFSVVAMSCSSIFVCSILNWCVIICVFLRWSYIFASINAYTPACEYLFF